MSDPTSIKTRFNTPGLLARSVLYHALAVLFRHPDAWEEDALSSEETGDWRAAARILAAESHSRLSESLESLLDQLGGIGRAELKIAYESVFGHSAHGACPPYELEYGEEHSHRQPQELGDIAAFYKAFGLQNATGVHERVDHVAVECEFVHFLLFKEVTAQHQRDEERAALCEDALRHFFADHLGRWLPSFTRGLSKQAPVGLIKALADFALELVVADCHALELHPGPRDLPLRSISQREETGCTSCTLKASLYHSAGGTHAANDFAI